MENYKDKVTKGKFEIKFSEILGSNIVFVRDEWNENKNVFKDKCIHKDTNIRGDNFTYIPQEELISNAILIAESFNVLHDSGYTPSELLAQRNELLEELKQGVDYLRYVVKNFTYDSDGAIGITNQIEDMDKAITNATK